MFDTYDPNEVYTKRLDVNTYEYVGVKRSDGANIPPNPLNRDYKIFLLWYDAQDPKPFDLLDESEPADVALERQKAEIKAKAGEDILALAPEWKQRNALARSIELLDKKVSGTISAEEETELAGIQSLWDLVKQIRAQSDADEAALEE